MWSLKRTTFQVNQDNVSDQLSEWKRKLVTREDPKHIHKILGFLVLLSFLYRFTQLGQQDLGFVNKPNLTIPTIMLHLALNLSAFEFTLPKRRITTGYRIWPEYRLHSLG